MDGKTLNFSFSFLSLLVDGELEVEQRTLHVSRFSAGVEKERRLDSDLSSVSENDAISECIEGTQQRGGDSSFSDLSCL